ncbi:transmembrane protein 252-like [Hippoglossus hippoglossus]|uniref:transmembrane protein 252-like n=1 Tax=Hippoglossus hippoglossus TaxID=8267 RepID=UPI00148CDFA4|nr:transmembrane protein 252-like [Hippoglossus hippoglossus]
MNAIKQMLSLACIILSCLGNGMTLIGVYLLSVQTELKLTWKTVPAYLLILFGLMVVLIGFFWNICHSIKTKMYQRRAPEQQIYTIDRPGSFPPSYEDSQLGQVSSDAPPESAFVDVEMSLAPPLYSQDSSQAPDCTWSWEQPPRYSQVGQQGQGGAEELRGETPLTER